MKNLDNKLLAAILMPEKDPQMQDQEKSPETASAQSKPFDWYNYLQKERPSEFIAVNELKQKLQTGNLHTCFCGMQ